MSTVSEKQLRQPKLTHNSVTPSEGQLIEEESVELGKVSWRMYWEYIKAFGTKRALAYLLVMFVLSSASEALANIWMAEWTSDLEHKGKNPKNLIVYGSAAMFNCK